MDHYDHRYVPSVVYVWCRCGGGGCCLFHVRQLARLRIMNARVGDCLVHEFGNISHFYSNGSIFTNTRTSVMINISLINQ